MELTGKLVCVAGGTGLAGSSVIRHLLAAHPGVRLRASYRASGSLLFDEDRVAWVAADLCDPSACRRLVRGCDAAIMTAAEAGGSASLSAEPWRQVNDNLVMNARLLEACVIEGVKRAVWVGSATLYQDLPAPIRESDLDLNQDPPPSYWGIGWTTRMIEKLAAFWHRSRGLEIVLVRAANIFGPRARFDAATSNFIPALVRKAVDKLEPFDVWGRPDVVRDAVYADDFAEAVAAMLVRDDIKFDVFNVGSGVPTTVGQVVAWALRYAGHQPAEVCYRGDAPVTVRFRQLDCSKAARLLGWHPRHTVESGIGETVAWWRVNRDTWPR